MTVKVFYDERQSAERNDSFSPSAQKPAKVVKYWEERHPIQIMPFEPVTLEDLCRIHDAEYVHGVMQGRITNGFGNCDPVVNSVMPWVSGSVYWACDYAYRTKESCFAPTSGAHHACYNTGMGYCTFNSLALGALHAHDLGANLVGIVDCDNHYGNGTQDIINKLGLHWLIHYSYGADQRRYYTEKFLEEFESLLMPFKHCDLIIYNAGADPHVDDPHGGRMTTNELFQRDIELYCFAAEHKIPVVTALAGGYQRDIHGGIQPVLDIHNNTMKAFRLMLEEVDLGDDF